MGNTLFHVRQRFPKRVFNVKSKEDLTVYKYYITERSWGNNGCPFELEWPWLSIPDMIAHKISEHAVEKL
jgi:hypothetical protein